MISIIEHADFYKHKMPQILESPQRLHVIKRMLELTGMLSNPALKIIQPEPTTEEMLQTLHSEKLIESIKYASLLGGATLREDTIANEHTFKAALRAVGGTILAGELALKKNNSTTYALTRPPGHHATKNQAMGFCFFNNVALAVNHLIETKQAKRIAIIDYDNHFGNGTADLFYERADILKISFHADPDICFPFQGRVSEIGQGNGEGYNICVPLPNGAGDIELLEMFDKVTPSVVRNFKPDLLFVSAGYDGLKDDPYGYLGFSVRGFQLLGERLAELAQETTDGKIAFALEGGYKYDELGQAFCASIEPFLPDYEPPVRKDSIKLSSGGNKNKLKNTQQELKKTLKPFWKLD